MYLWASCPTPGKQSLLFSVLTQWGVRKGWFVLAILASCFRNTCFIVSASGRDCPDITSKQSSESTSSAFYFFHFLPILCFSISLSPFPLPHSPSLGTDTLFIPLRRKRNHLCHGPLGPHVLKFVIR